MWWIFILVIILNVIAIVINIKIFEIGVKIFILIVIFVIVILIVLKKMIIWYIFIFRWFLEIVIEVIVELVGITMIITLNLYVIVGVIILRGDNLIITQLNYIISILYYYSLGSHIYFYIIKLKIHGTHLIHLNGRVTSFYSHSISISLIIEIHLFCKI